MAQESTVQLNPDAGVNKNVIRVIKVNSLATLVEQVASGNYPIQEVVVLADADGTIIGAVDGKQLGVADLQSHSAMNAICRRLDSLIMQFDSGYEPDDGFGLSNEES